MKGLVVSCDGAIFVYDQIWRSTHDRPEFLSNTDFIRKTEQMAYFLWCPVHNLWPVIYDPLIMDNKSEGINPEMCLSRIRPFWIILTGKSVLK